MRNKWWLPLALFAGLTLLATYPGWLQPAEMVPGDIGDPLLNTWTLAWDAHALLVQPGRFFDANIFFPLSNTLAYSEHLFSSAILVFPLSALTRQPVLVYNVSLLLSFPMCGLGMYWLVLRWTRCRLAAFVAGVAFAFAPYRLAAIAHLQLLTLQWLPLTILGLDGLLTASGRRRHRWTFLFAVFLGLQVLASWYLAVFSGLIVAVYMLSWFVAAPTGLGKTRPRSPGRPIIRLILALFLVALCCLPFALPYLPAMPELLATRPPEMAASLSAFPADYLATSSSARLLGPVTEIFRRRPNFTQENTLYAGAITVTLALVGLASALRAAPSGFTWPPGGRWRVLALAVTAAVAIGLTFSPPYLALVRLIPAAQVVRVPARWMIPAGFALAGLAGFGSAAVVRRLIAIGKRRSGTGRRGLARGITAALIVLVMAESFSAPVPLAEAGLTPDQRLAYEHLGTLATSGAASTWGVIELPMHVAPHPEYPETKRLLASTVGWWGLVNGYSGLTPARQTALAADMADFPDDASMEALRSLAGQNVRYLLVHADQLQERPEWEDRSRWLAEADPTLLPAGRWGANHLYAINTFGADWPRQPSIVGDGFWSTLNLQAADVRFSSPAGDSISLLAALATSAGSETQLTLYWQANEPVHGDYTVFVHSLDATGAILSQADGPPVSGHLPTSQWETGVVVQDNRALSPGSTYLVGLYDPHDGSRLAAATATGTALANNAYPILP